jgi:hypothetical protein
MKLNRKPFFAEYVPLRFVFSLRPATLQQARASLSPMRGPFHLEHSERKPMTPRSIRRLAERRANKLARKAATQGTLAGEDQFLAAHPETSIEAPATNPEPAIILAAEANLHLRSIASTLNGQVTLVATTDAAPYAQLLSDYENELQPVGLQESNLVQTLAETTWRMRRSIALESAIFAKGRIEFAKQFAEHNPGIRESLLDVHTFLTYEKQIRGLQLQESRLSRRADKITAELRTLQQERRKQEALPQRQLQAPAPVKPVGSVFSNRAIDQQPTQTQPAKPRVSLPPNPPLRAQAA